MLEKLNFNGQIIQPNQAIFSAHNRAFKFGDALFETIRVFDGKIPFLSLHFDRLQKGMSCLDMLYSTAFFDNLLVQILRLIHDQGNWRLRLTVFRNDGGLYTPTANDVQFLIAAIPLSNPYFTLNQTGLKMGYSTQQYLSYSLLSSLKTTNSLPYILAALEKKKNQWDDILIHNTEGTIAEALSANVFLVMDDDTIITPPLSAACIAGTTRAFLLHKQPIKICEENIDIHKIKQAKSIFLTNAIKGIQWVSMVNNYSFERDHKIDRILYMLNDYVMK